MPEPDTPVEVLGEVSTGSGNLVLIDFGLLHLWSGDDPPVLDEEDLPDIAPQANQAVDLEIVGPDADAAARLADLGFLKGRFAFDVLDESFVVDKVTALCSERELKVEVNRIPRMPHLERLHRLLDEHPAAEVPFHGLRSVAVRGVPEDVDLPVVGRRMHPEGRNRGRWKSVEVRCRDVAAVSSELVGHVLVDRDRLLFADPTVLAAWRTDETYDGLVDIAFWGRDEGVVVQRTNATMIELDGERPVFGWVDQPVEEAVRRLERLDVLEEQGLRVAIDLRPHDDHHRLLVPARRSPTGSAVIEVGGQRVSGFFTSWGDGAYPVYRDLGPDGELVGLRVQLGAPEVVQRRRLIEQEAYNALAKRAVVSARVARDEEPIRWLYREAPDHAADSGWRMLSGDESSGYANDPDNFVNLPLHQVIEMAPHLEPLLDTPPPAAFRRGPDGFEPIPPPVG